MLARILDREASEEPDDGAHENCAGGTKGPGNRQIRVVVVTRHVGTHLSAICARRLARGAVATAVALFGMNLFGYGVGPWVAGALSDWFGGEEALRLSLMALNGVMLWACVHYYLAAQTYRQDLGAKDQD